MLARAHRRLGRDDRSRGRSAAKPDLVPRLWHIDPCALYLINVANAKLLCKRDQVERQVPRCRDARHARQHIDLFGKLVMPSDKTGSWMPVALSQDLPAGTVMPARMPAGSIALWRSHSGRVAASADRCPHRGMRLSHGFVRGEALSCIYHGWSYCAGRKLSAHPRPSRP